MRSRAGSREMEQIQPHRQYNSSSLQHRQRVVRLPRRHSLRRQAHAASGRPPPRSPLPFWRLTLRWWGTGRYWCWPAGPWSWLGARLSHQWRWQFWCEPPKPGGSHWSCCPAFQLCSQWTRRGGGGMGRTRKRQSASSFPCFSESKIQDDTQRWQQRRRRWQFLPRWAICDIMSL